MKGLILKDFINLKRNVKIFIIITIIYAVMAITTEDTSFFSTVLIVMVSVLTLALFSYDEMAKWDSFALTMPISKKNVVQGKYFLMLLLTFIGMVYSSIFTVIINIYKKTSTIFTGFKSVGMGAAVVILFFCITIPFITKLGIEKARIILFALFIVPFAIITGLSSLINNGDLVIQENLMDVAKFLLKYIYILVPLIMLIALGISYRVSVGIYKKKEF